MVYNIPVLFYFISLTIVLGGGGGGGGTTVKPVMRGHLNMCPYMDRCPPRHRYISMLKYILVNRKCNFRHPDSCPLVTGFTVYFSTGMLANSGISLEVYSDPCPRITKYS